MAREGKPRGPVAAGTPRCARSLTGRIGCSAPTTGAFLFLALLLSVPPPAVAQTLPAGGMGVDRFGPAEGLPGSYIPDLATTGDGLLWMIASGRLTSFDGLVFEEHDVPEVIEWRGGSIVGIGAGRADTLWLTVGPRLLSRVGGRTHLRAEHDMILRDVWQEDDGGIWGWDDLGVVRLGEAGFERVVELMAGWNWDRLPPLSDDPWSADDVWIQDARSGTLRRVHQEWLVSRLPLPESWSVPGEEGEFLVSRSGAGPTMEVTTPAGRRLGSLPASAESRVMLVDSRSLIWVAAPGRVEVFEPSGEPVTSLPLSRSASVRSAIEDREGNLWVGTVADGLYRIRGRPIRVLGAGEGLTDGAVERVSDGGDEGVLALDAEGRVSRVSEGTARTLFGWAAEAGEATAAVTDRSGTVWVAVIRSGEAWLAGRSREGRDLRIPLPAGFSPVRIVEDPGREDVLWLVGGRVYAVHVGEGAVVEGPYLSAEWGARDLLVDREGAVWVAGPRGVARISGEEVREFLATDGFPTGEARALHQSDDGALWIGRYFGGLVRYRDGRFQAVRAADGLWDDVVSSILEDDAGDLWMGSNRGVHRVARGDLDAFLAGRLPRVRGVGYGVSAGLRNPEASGWHGHRTGDGRLWLPTFSGLAVIDPVAVRAQERTTPRVRITTINTGQGLRPPAPSVMLERGERRLDVAFAAALLSGQAGLRYEVLMEGVDPDWVDVGGQRQVSYASVPAGERTLRVRAVSASGVRSPGEAGIVLSVPPYFHETAAFYFVLAMMAAGALWATYRLRTRQLRARQVELGRLVDERTLDLVRSRQETERALSTVEAQAEDLRSLDEAKSRFFANVSHELRTPLTLVQGPLQDVLDGLLGPTPEPVRDQVEIVLASGHRLGELVEQLLDVARIESGELVLNVRQEDLKPMLERLASSFGALARNRGIRLETSLPEGPVQVNADADHLEKVYGNLLANAVKFTPAGGRVRFMVEVENARADGDLVAVVEDDGPGIPEEEHARVFERFHQVDGSASRAHGGAGLGLAIVEEIVHMHGGRVELWSEPGRGSRFTVRVPLAGVRVDMPPAATPERGGGGASAGSDAATRTPAEGRDSERGVPEGPDDALRPTVLVVEDHDELRSYLRRHLADHYRVVEAADGAEGLEIARSIVPDLVLCDMMMPVMDGEALCREIRADPELDFLPVIMVTAKASRASRLSALEGGADDYIVKPFDPAELRLRVGNLLAARRRLEERLREKGMELPLVDLGVAARGADPSFAGALEAVLAEHMADEEFGVEAMAKALAMSRATLYRKTDDALGVAPMEILWRFRLRQAAHVLRQTDATVSEVAYACGFKTVPHFTRRFKDLFGATPAAYRQAPGSLTPGS